MSSGAKVRQGQANDQENVKVGVKSFSSRSAKTTMSSSRPKLHVLQPLSVNSDFGKSARGAVPKRKRWLGQQSGGPKRVKMEAKSTQTEDVSALSASDEAYELLVEETPPPAYWKEIAEERRKALFDVLQENEKLHKDTAAKDERIARLKSDNEELRELADHVRYMADVIERLTGKGPDHLREMKGLAPDDHEEEEEAEEGGERQE